MDYMDQSVDCKKCGKETSSIITGICFTCEKAVLTANRLSLEAAKDDITKALEILESFANPQHLTFSHETAAFVLRTFRSALAGQVSAQPIMGLTVPRSRFNAMENELQSCKDELGHVRNVAAAEIERLQASAQEVRDAALTEAQNACMHAVASKGAVNVIGVAAHYAACGHAIEALKSAPITEQVTPSADATDAARFRKVVENIGMYAGWWQVQIRAANLLGDDLEKQFIEAIDAAIAQAKEDGT
jgi:hypothetical protein